MRKSSRRSTPSSPTSWRPVPSRATRWTCSSPGTTSTRKHAARRSSRASDCVRWIPGRCPWRGHWSTPACCRWASSPTPSSTPTSQSASAFSAECTGTTASRITLLIRNIHMHVFVTGGTGQVGSYLIPDLIAAGHEVVALARSDASAAAASALGARVRRGNLADLDGLKAAAAESDGVIHLGYRAELLSSGGITALGDSELSIVLAFGEALAGTGKPLVAAGSIGAPTNLGRAGPLLAPASLGRPATEDDPALPCGPMDAGTLVARNIVETAVVGLAEKGVRSSVVRI